MNNDARYYCRDKLFAYREFLNFSISERGLGKTTNGKFWVVDHFKKTKRKTCWVRRYNSELSGDKKKGIEGCVKTFFDKIQKYYPNDKLETKKNKMLVNGQEAGCFVALSTSASMKSVDFVDYDTIIFDEFLIIKGSKNTYLTNEVTLFLELISTVFRPITDDNGKEAYMTRVWCLANAITFANDYFYYFNIKPFRSRFYHDKQRGIVVEQCENPVYREAVKRTRFGKLIQGTAYENYSVDNKYMQDTDDFLGKKSSDATMLYNIRYDGHEWGIYADSLMFYVTWKIDKTRPFYVFTKSDHTLDSVLLKSVRGTIFEALIRAYQLGLFKCENIMIKNKFIDFMKLFIVK